MAARLLAAALGLIWLGAARGLSLDRDSRAAEASLGADGYPRGLSRAVSLLGTQADRLHSADLAALAVRASQQISSRDPDAMENVKGLIRHMLANAMEDHAAATDRAHFCSEEVPKSKQRLDTLKDRVEKAQADFDKLSAETDELKDSITELHAQVAEAHKSASKAAEIRDKEHEAYAEAKTAYEHSEAKAVSSAAKAEDEDAADARAAAEQAADASLRGRVKAETAEAAKDLAFRRQQQELKESIVLKEKEAKFNEHKVITNAKEMAEAQQDLRGLQEEMAASKTYEEQVAHQCTVPASSHAERRERRQGEIDSLKDAYKILSGDDIPVLSF